MAHADEDGWSKVGTKSSNLALRPPPFVVFCHNVAGGAVAPKVVFDHLRRLQPKAKLIERPRLIQFGKNLPVECIAPDVFLVCFEKQVHAENCLVAGKNGSLKLKVSWWSERLDEILQSLCKEWWCFTLFLGSGQDQATMKKSEIQRVFDPYGELYHPNPKHSISISKSENGRPFAMINFRTFAEARSCHDHLRASCPTLSLTEMAQFLSIVIEELERSSPPSYQPLSSIIARVKKRESQKFKEFVRKFRDRFNGLMVLTNHLPNCSETELFLQLCRIQDPTLFELRRSEDTSGFAIRAIPNTEAAVDPRPDQVEEAIPILLETPARAGGVYKTPPPVAPFDVGGNALRLWQERIQTYAGGRQSELTERRRALESMVRRLEYRQDGRWDIALAGDKTPWADAVLSCGDTIQTIFGDHSFEGFVVGVDHRHVTVQMPEELRQFAQSQGQVASARALGIDSITTSFRTVGLDTQIERLRHLTDCDAAVGNAVAVEHLQEHVRNLQKQLASTQGLCNQKLQATQRFFDEKKAELAAKETDIAELKRRVEERAFENTHLRNALSYANKEKQQLHDKLLHEKETDIAMTAQLAKCRAEVEVLRTRNAELERSHVETQQWMARPRVAASCQTECSQPAPVKATSSRHESANGSLATYDREVSHENGQAGPRDSQRDAGSRQPADPLQEPPPEIHQPKARNAAPACALDDQFPPLGSVAAVPKKRGGRLPPAPKPAKSVTIPLAHATQEVSALRGCLQCSAAGVESDEAFCTSCVETGVFFLTGELAVSKKKWSVIHVQCAPCTKKGAEGHCTCELVKNFASAEDAFECEGRPGKLKAKDEVYFLPARRGRASLVHAVEGAYSDSRVVSVADLCAFPLEQSPASRNQGCGTVDCPTLHAAGILDKVWDQKLCFNRTWVESYQRGEMSIIIGRPLTVPTIMAVRPEGVAASKWMLLACKPRCLLSGRAQVLPSMATVLEKESLAGCFGQRVMPNSGWWTDERAHLRTCFELLWTETFFPMSLLMQCHARGEAAPQWGQVYKDVRFLQLVLRRAHFGLRMQTRASFGARADNFRASNLIAMVVRAGKDEARSQDCLFWATADTDERSLRGGIVDIYLVTPDKGGGVQHAGADVVMQVLEKLISGGRVTLFESESFFEAHRHSLSRLAALVNLEQALPGHDELVQAPCKDSDGDGDLSRSKMEFETSQDLPEDVKGRMNAGQYRAFRYAIDNVMPDVFRLVVGPPGTGKSHVGTLLLNYLCQPSSTDGKVAQAPILLVSNNNMAVDSCLSALVQVPINNFQPGTDIVRIGGQSSLPPEYKLKAPQENKASSNLSAVSKEAEISESESLQVVCQECQTPMLAKSTFLISISHKGSTPVTVSQVRVVDKDGADIYAQPPVPCVLHSEANTKLSFHIKTGCSKVDVKIRGRIGAAASHSTDAGVAFESPVSFDLSDMEPADFRLVRPGGVSQIRGMGRRGQPRKTGGRDGHGRYRKEEQVEDGTEDFDVVELAGAKRVAEVFRDAAKKNRFDDELGALLRRAEKKEKARDESLCRALGQCKVIGATVTGATKYAHLLSELQIRTVMVEEAAQTIEGDLLAVLPPSAERVLMLGDHRQTQPNLDSNVWKRHPGTIDRRSVHFDLGLDQIRPNLSLFERLIRCRHSHVSLTAQYRMPNVLADVVRCDDPEWPLYQRSLYHDGEVPLALGKRRLDFMKRCKIWSGPESVGDQCIHFINHELPEQQVTQNGFRRGYHNPGEAGMVVGMVDWLLRQGIDARRITVLSMYKAQVVYIEHQLKNLSRQRAFDDFRDRAIEDDCALALSKVKAFTVDGFQGAENDIILLSLTRSNREGKQGWLQDYRRIGVALSRAKVAQFVFGNFTCLSIENAIQNAAARCSAGRIWQTVVNVSQQHAGFSEHGSVRIQCQIHPEETATVDLCQLSPAGLPVGFAAFAPDGGCSRDNDTGLAPDCDSKSNSESDEDDWFLREERGAQRNGIVGRRCARCDGDLKLLCHPSAQSKVSCLRRCKRVLPCKHRCVRQCRHRGPCDPCLHPELRELPCGHTHAVPCCVAKKVHSCTTLRAELEKLRSSQAAVKDDSTSPHWSTDTLAFAVPGICAGFAPPTFYSVHECRQCRRSVFLECGQEAASLTCVLKDIPSDLECSMLHLVPHENTYHVTKPFVPAGTQSRLDPRCCTLRGSLDEMHASLVRLIAEGDRRVVVADWQSDFTTSKEAGSAGVGVTALSIDFKVDSSLLATGWDIEANLRESGCKAKVETRAEPLVAARLRSLAEETMSNGCERRFLKILFNPGLACDFRPFAPPDFKGWKGSGGSELPIEVTVILQDRADKMDRRTAVQVRQPNVQVQLVDGDDTVGLGMAHLEVLLATSDFFPLLIKSDDHGASKQTGTARSKKRGGNVKTADETGGQKFTLQFNGAVVTVPTVRALLSYAYSPPYFLETARGDPLPSRELLQLLRLSFLLGLMHLHHCCESLIHARFGDDTSVMAQVALCFDEAVAVSDPMQQFHWFFPATACDRVQAVWNGMFKSDGDTHSTGGASGHFWLNLHCPQLRDALFAPSLRSLCQFYSQPALGQYRVVSWDAAGQLESLVAKASRDTILQRVSPSTLRWKPDCFAAQLQMLTLFVSNEKIDTRDLEALLTFQAEGRQLTHTVSTKQGNGEVRLDLSADDEAALKDFSGFRFLDVRLCYDEGDARQHLPGQVTVRLHEAAHIEDVRPRTIAPGGAATVSVRDASADASFGLWRPRSPALVSNVSSEPSHHLEVISSVETGHLWTYRVRFPADLQPGLFDLGLNDANRYLEDATRVSISPSVRQGGWRLDPGEAEYEPEDLTGYLRQLFSMFRVTNTDTKRAWIRRLYGETDNGDDVASEVFTSSLGQHEFVEPDGLQCALIVIHSEKQDEVICCVGGDHMFSKQDSLWTRVVIPATEEAPHVVKLWDYLKRNLAVGTAADIPPSLDDLCQFITKYQESSGLVDLQYLSFDEQPHNEAQDQGSEAQADDVHDGDFDAAAESERSQPTAAPESSLAKYAEQGLDVETYSGLTQHRGRHKCMLFKAHDRVSSLPVAIKVPKAVARNAGDVRAQVLREWEALQYFGIHRSNQDRVVSGVARLDAWQCVVMPWCEGEALDSIMRSDSSMPPISQLVTILNDVAVGLDHMHDHGWLHGSVCPGNVLVHGSAAKLTGLTLSARFPAEMSESIQLENLRCAAPECLVPNTPCDPRADVYGVGTILLFWFKGIWHSQYLETGMDKHITAVTANRLRLPDGPKQAQESQTDAIQELESGARSGFARWKLLCDDKDKAGQLSAPNKLSAELRGAVFEVAKRLVREEVTSGGAIDRLSDGTTSPLRECAKSMNPDDRDNLQLIAKRCLDVDPEQRPTANDFQVQLMSFQLLVSSLTSPR